jgi:hypothetical protein
MTLDCSVVVSSPEVWDGLQHVCFVSAVCLHETLGMFYFSVILCVNFLLAPSPHFVDKLHVLFYNVFRLFMAIIRLNIYIYSLLSVVFPIHWSMFTFGGGNTCYLSMLMPKTMCKILKLKYFICYSLVFLNNVDVLFTAEVVFSSVTTYRLYYIKIMFFWSQ